jgi:hypothetical protein
MARFGLGIGREAAVAEDIEETIAEPDAPAITFDRVGVAYGRGKKATDALVDFNLRVAAGETVALLGPSGSGKSTALNALAGFVRPTTGAVLLGGRDVTDLPPAKRGIGVVLQSYALFPHMRVSDNVAFGPSSPRYFCSTSRSPRSTRSCGTPCSRSCNGSRRRCRTPRCCTSPTTRVRRWPLPTASW